MHLIYGSILQLYHLLECRVNLYPPYELREVFKCNECLVDQFILFFVYLKSVLQLTFLRLLDQNRALVLSLSVPINICFL